MWAVAQVGNVLTYVTYNDPMITYSPRPGRFKRIRAESSYFIRYKGSIENLHDHISHQKGHGFVPLQTIEDIVNKEI